MSMPRSPRTHPLVWPVAPDDMDTIAVIDLEQPLRPQVLALATESLHTGRTRTAVLVALAGATSGLTLATALLTWYR